MTRIFLAVLALALFAPTAKAQMATFVVSSSCTYSTVAVSSGTWKKRIDNLNNGSTSIMKGRNKVTINVPPGSFQIWAGFDSSVDSNKLLNHYGRVLSTGPNEFFIATTIGIYAQAESPAGVSGQTVNVEQCRPMEPVYP